MEGPGKDSHLVDKSKKDIDVDSVLAHMVNSAQLVVLKQGCVAQENWSKNGIQKIVHVVVKNNAFTVEFASTMDLTKCSIEAMLLYDSDREEDLLKLRVQLVKNEPMEYKTTTQDSGNKGTMEIRIHVLTSQHEDMLFRVRLSVFDPQTNTTYYTLTHPIKVISKVTQLKKKDIVPSSPPMAMAVTPVPKKRVSTTLVGTDMVSGSISRIETAQAEQLRLLTAIANKILLDSASNPEPITVGLPMTLNNSVEFHSDISGIPQGNVKDEMELSFRKFINCFSLIAPEERKEKWIELLETIAERSDADAAKAAEFVEVVEGTSSPTAKRLKILKVAKTLH